MRILIHEASVDESMRSIVSQTIVPIMNNAADFIYKLGTHEPTFHDKLTHEQIGQILSSQLLGVVMRSSLFNAPLVANEDREFAIRLIMKQLSK